MPDASVPDPGVPDPSVPDAPREPGQAGSDGLRSNGQPAARRIAPLIVLAVAVVIAGFFVILARSKVDNAETGYSPLLGKPAPSVRATTLDGTTFDLQHRKGSWVVLNFFNVTCGPCVKEHPELVKFASEQQDAANAPVGAELYSIVWNDLDGGTADFFRTNSVSWPVVIDENADIAVKFGVAKVPETWIIDPNGYVVLRVISNLTDDELTNYLNREVAIYDGTSATAGTRP